MDIKKILKALKNEVQKRRTCSDESWIDYPGTGKITDRDVWNHVKKHTRWFDFLNPRLIVHYALMSQMYLMGDVLEEKSDPKWKY